MIIAKKDRAAYYTAEIVQAIAGLALGLLFWITLFSIPSFSEIIGK